MPISTMLTSPASSLPGFTCSPIFEPWKVAVTSAFTASPCASPLDASTPEGTSQATTGASWPLMARIAPDTGSRGSPEKPVPSSASTTAPDPSRRPASSGRGGSPGSRSRFARASPFKSATSPTASTSTRCPSSRRIRAATRPSPPLLPFPITIRTGPGPRGAAAVTRANPIPACSMRSSEGTPCSSIAQESTARISPAS